MVVTSTVVVSAKTTSDAFKANPFPPDPNSSQSTINTVAREIQEVGECSRTCDVRDFENITSLVDETIRQLGSIDVLIYNSGAIWWSSVENTPMKRFQLMQRINPEGSCSNCPLLGALVGQLVTKVLGLYGSVQACLPHWKRQKLASSDHCCFAANLFTILPRKDSLCNG
jgi:NAD(P)-dependent dehydrogenase (short-subunit alcohol dehydrogenase family)